MIYIIDFVIFLLLEIFKKLSFSWIFDETVYLRFK